MSAIQSLSHPSATEATPADCAPEATDARLKVRSRRHAFARILAARRRRAAGRPAGFTFIEVLVVLIILALIAGIVGTQLLGEAEKAKAEATRIQIKSLESALSLYRLHNSTYPTSEQGLQALLTKPEVGTIPENWQGPYIQANHVPKDGWKHDFLYVSDGHDYTIISLGADGKEGGTGLDADISSKDL